MAEREIKYIDVKEFREQGYLSELNRRFLHPLGLALATRVNVDGTESLDGIWDDRDDPEGIIYGGDYAEVVAKNAAAIEKISEERAIARIEKLGYMVQPAEGIE